MTPQSGEREAMRQLADAGDVAAFLREARHVHPSDLSDVLADLAPAIQLRLVQALPLDMVSEALADMTEEEHPEALLAALTPEQAAHILEHVDDDDAVDLIADLPPVAARRILQRVANRADLERLLRYDEESAGGRMTTAMVTVQSTATLAEALAEIRRQSEHVEDLYQVYCVDPSGRLVGVLPLQQLVTANPDARVGDVLEPVTAVARTDTDQEEVARLLARYDVAAVPVVDALGRLVGRVTFDDVIDVVEQEGTEDLLKFGGVPADEELTGTWTSTIASRLPWLYVNLATAFLAGAVVYVFQGTISRAVAIAVWMPIIAGMGGNAGTQALAVTVRRISLEMIPRGQGVRIVVKELAVGLVNGLACGVVSAAVAVLIGQPWQLGLVVVLAMWGNLGVAGVAGSFVPLALERIGVDPAVASSIFVTTFTDICGFLLLLGLAAALVLPH